MGGAAGRQVAPRRTMEAVRARGVRARRTPSTLGWWRRAWWRAPWHGRRLGRWGSARGRRVGVVGGDPLTTGVSRRGGRRGGGTGRVPGAPGAPSFRRLSDARARPCGVPGGLVPSALRSDAALAQLDRASDYGSEGWGFDSLAAPLHHPPSPLRGTHGKGSARLIPRDSPRVTEAHPECGASGVRQGGRGDRAGRHPFEACRAARRPDRRSVADAFDAPRLGRRLAGLSVVREGPCGRGRPKERGAEPATREAGNPADGHRGPQGDETNAERAAHGGSVLGRDGRRAVGRRPGRTGAGGRGRPLAGVPGPRRRRRVAELVRDHSCRTSRTDFRVRSSGCVLQPSIGHSMEPSGSTWTDEVYSSRVSSAASRTRVTWNPDPERIQVPPLGAYRKAGGFVPLICSTSVPSPKNSTAIDTNETLHS